MKRDTPETGYEFVISHDGLTCESWVFCQESPALRCRWPTASAAARLAEDLRSPDGAGYLTRRAAANILRCYAALIAHPMGTERAVLRLRALRRAEVARERGEVTG